MDIISMQQYGQIFMEMRNYLKKKIILEIKKNENIIFYKSANNECYYSSSPCTHFFNGKDFKIDEINLKIIKNYKVYFFKK